MNKTINTTSLSFILFLSVIIFSLFACCREDPKQIVPKQIVDSPTERKVQAQKLIEKYSMSEWQNDIVEKIAGVAGKAVSQEVKSRAALKLSDNAVLEKRISLLTTIYNANELARLTELYSSETDNRLLKKSSIYDEKLRELVSPLVMEVLSNSQ